MNKKINNIIRVANIIEEGRLGGPQSRMTLVASALDKKINTTFILPKKDSKEFQDLCKLIGIKYYLFSFTRISRNWIIILKYIIFFPFEIIMLSKYLKKNSFDIVHLSGGSRQFKGLIAAKIARIKVVWELNDTYAPSLIRNIFLLLSKLANGLIFASKRTKKYYEKFNLNKKESFLIQSPVDVNYFDPRLYYPKEKFLEKFVKEKKIIIGTVANVSPVKDLTFFIETAEKLSSYSINFLSESVNNIVSLFFRFINSI